MQQRVLEKTYLKSKFERKVSDIVHGFILLPHVIWDFIDTEQFQRMRHIKQLSVLSHVFPCANHSRFEHSLGTAHLARKYIMSLIEKDEESYSTQEIKRSAELTVTLAGLLHDIGHGPFSHSFEHVVRQCAPSLNKWSHEEAGIMIIEYMLLNHPHLRTHLSSQDEKRVKDLIIGTRSGPRPWQFDIIANKRNGIDVDKLDYFRRDAFYLNARKVFIQHELLISQSKVFNKEIICYPTKYADSVNDIFHGRYKLYKNCYNNTIAKGIQYMYLDIFKLIAKKFKIAQACKNPSEYIKLTDTIINQAEFVFLYLKQDPQWPSFEKAMKIIERIRTRNMYKYICGKHFYLKEDLHKTEAEQIQHFKQLQDQFNAQLITKEMIENGVEEETFVVSIDDSGFGLKHRNPLRNVNFFSKQTGELKESVHNEEFSMMITESFAQRSVRVFYKGNDYNNPAVRQKLQWAFECFWKKHYKQFQTFHVKLFKGEEGKTEKYPQQFIQMKPNQFTTTQNLRVVIASQQKKQK